MSGEAKTAECPAKYAGAGLSLTFGDQAENHAGMQILGKPAEAGFTRAELEEARARLAAAGHAAELVDLRPALEAARRAAEDAEEYGPLSDLEDACVLVVRGGLGALLPEASATDLMEEHMALPVDTKAWMRGRVVNKRARHNLCYADEAQAPDYEAKRGRIVAFDSVPLLSALRSELPAFLGPKAAGLVAELNLYYDVTRCGIGYHGDTERRIVVCARLGESVPLQYQWFRRFRPVGEPVRLELGHGDVYVMGAKAVGYDWKRSSVYTLRHAAGADKFMRTRRT